MSTNWVSDINMMHQKYGVHEWTKTASPYDLKKFKMEYLVFKTKKN